MDMADYNRTHPHVVIIGAGFTSLAAGYEIAKASFPVTILEKDDRLGGLAASFSVGKQQLEKFYHHWFTSDENIIALAKELNSDDQLVYTCPKIGFYYQYNLYKFSSLFDVLRFKPLNLLERLRFGFMVMRARHIKDWQELESLTAQQWLRKLFGPNSYRIIWEPLLRGKFGELCSEVSAAWLWNKIVLRGGSRSKSGKELLIYYKGGLKALIDRIADEISLAGGTIKTSCVVEDLIVKDGRVKGVKTSNGVISSSVVIATPALPVFASLVEPYVSKRYLNKLRSIRYLANICLVLELTKSLSDIYWLNISDVNFPFVGLIEHTRFQPANLYEDRHIVYLSKYLLENDEFYSSSDEKIFENSISKVKQMFPQFDESWVLRYHVWRARYAQPLVTCGYRHLIPSYQTPIKGLYLTTMAQIYPEDRGTNYSVKEGRYVGRMVIDYLSDRKK